MLSIHLIPDTTIGLHQLMCPIDPCTAPSQHSMGDSGKGAEGLAPIGRGTAGAASGLIKARWAGLSRRETLPGGACPGSVALGLARARNLNAAPSAGASGPPDSLPSTLAPPSPGSPAALPRASTPCGLSGFSGLNLRSSSSMLTKPLQGLPSPPMTPTQPPGGKDRAAFEAEYRLGPLLGKGGFGTVFAGHRVTDRRQVAIKVISRNRVLGWSTVVSVFWCTS
nr:serine/threonine-protein kinase pim-2 [Meriones unguiculatus]